MNTMSTTLQVNERVICSSTYVHMDCGSSSSSSSREGGTATCAEVTSSYVHDVDGRKRTATYADVAVTKVQRLSFNAEASRIEFAEVTGEHVQVVGVVVPVGTADAIKALMEMQQQPERQQFQAQTAAAAHLFLPRDAGVPVRQQDTSSSSSSSSSIGGRYAVGQALKPNFHHGRGPLNAVEERCVEDLDPLHNYSLTNESVAIAAIYNVFKQRIHDSIKRREKFVHLANAGTEEIINLLKEYFRINAEYSREGKSREREIWYCERALEAFAILSKDPKAVLSGEQKRAWGSANRFMQRVGLTHDRIIVGDGGRVYPDTLVEKNIMIYTPRLYMYTADLTARDGSVVAPNVMVRPRSKVPRKATEPQWIDKYQ
jgi:hypothetical protein